MKKYKIEVDCANCAAKMEEATKKVAGVKDATVAFMAQKMSVEFDDGADEAEVMKNDLRLVRRLSLTARSLCNQRRLCMCMMTAGLWYSRLFSHG